MVVEVLAPDSWAGPDALTRRVLLSAHAGGSEGSGASWTSLRAAVSQPVDFVQFSVQRTADGVYVAFGGPGVSFEGASRRIETLTVTELESVVGPLPRYLDVVRLIASHGKKAHIDLAFTSPEHTYAHPETTFEAQVACIAANILAPGYFLLTSFSDAGVRALRLWSLHARYPLLVGLCLGADLTGVPPLARMKARLSEFFPTRRVAECGPNLLVAPRDLATLRVISWSWTHARLPVLVRDVETPKDMVRLFADKRVWMVCTRAPELAPRGAATKTPLAQRTSAAARMLLWVGWALMLIILFLALNSRAPERIPLDNPAAPEKTTVDVTWSPPSSSLR